MVVIEKKDEPVIRLNFNGIGLDGQIINNDKRSQRSVEAISGHEYERRREERLRP